MNRLSNNQKRVAALAPGVGATQAMAQDGNAVLDNYPGSARGYLQRHRESCATLPGALPSGREGPGGPSRHAQVFTRRIRHRRDAARPKSPHPFLWCRP